MELCKNVNSMIVVTYKLFVQPLGSEKKVRWCFQRMKRWIEYVLFWYCTAVFTYENNSQLIEAAIVLHSVTRFNASFSKWYSEKKYSAFDISLKDKIVFQM